MMRTLVIAVAWLAVSALVVVLAVQNRGLRTQRDARQGARASAG